MNSFKSVGKVLALAALASVAAVSLGQSSFRADMINRQAAYAIDNNPYLVYNPYTVLVKFREDAPSMAQAVAMHEIGGIELGAPGIVPGLRILSTSIEPRAAVAALEQIPGVEYAEVDYIVRTQAFPNDPSFNQLWGLHNTGQSGGTVDADIDAPEAWDIYKGNSNTVVAIIDTGFLRTHPDLAANSWTNPDEIPGNGIDDDSNGYVDDLYGWDFVNNDNNPTDDHSHGTHCSGTIGGVGNNNTGVTGVNWNVKMLGLKFLGSNGSGSTSNAIKAVDYCRIKGIKISNNSWGGGGFSQAMFDAIQAAGNAGHIFVAAAGNNNSNNNNSNFYPANYNLPNVISVAATDRFDAKSSFSNYGTNTVELGAPGSDIYSTVLNNGYGSKSGTSMACPHVTGAVALLWGLKPSWTKEQVIQGVLTTVRPTSAMSTRTITGGVLNIENMLVAANGGNNTAPQVTITSPPNGGNANQFTGITFTGTAIDAQDGNLTASLVWTSNLNGQIGTGGSFVNSTLSAGVHVITAWVVDSGNMPGEAQITFTVNVVTIPVAPSEMRISKDNPTTLRVVWLDNSNNENGFEVYREQFVANQWTNPTTFNVGANLKSYTDHPGTGRFRYRVRAYNGAGASTWSNWARGRL
ncbi:MAG: S8 family serine peptidase [Fimbriimonadaceae bacterium]|nr:S8 family serine peptidase [Fimbriimonadaceae bacterium]